MVKDRREAMTGEKDQDIIARVTRGDVPFAGSPVMTKICATTENL